MQRKQYLYFMRHTHTHTHTHKQWRHLSFSKSWAWGEGVTFLLKGLHLNTTPHCICTTFITWHTYFREVHILHLTGDFPMGFPKGAGKLGNRGRKHQWHWAKMAAAGLFYVRQLEPEWHPGRHSQCAIDLAVSGARGLLLDCLANMG